MRGRRLFAGRLPVGETAPRSNMGKDKYYFRELRHFAKVSLSINDKYYLFFKKESPIFVTEYSTGNLCENQTAIDMKFLKTFLASLLAFVVGGGGALFPFADRDGGYHRIDHLVRSGDDRQPCHPEDRPGEDITDSPSTAPFGNIDLATMTPTRQISLMNALRAIEAAKMDPRIQGIYLRLNGSGVTSLSISGGAARCTGGFPHQRQVRAGL